MGSASPSIWLCSSPSQLADLLDHLCPVGGRLHAAQHRQHLVAVFVADIQRALAGASRQLGQAEAPGQPLAVAARLEAEQRVEPALGDLVVHDGVERAVDQRPRPQPRQRPEAVRRHRTARERLQQRYRPSPPCAARRAVPGWRPPATSRPARSSADAARWCPSCPAPACRAVGRRASVAAPR